eukprot:1908164-Amphidinium_carterae.2
MLRGRSWTSLLSGSVDDVSSESEEGVPDQPQEGGGLKARSTQTSGHSQDPNQEVLTREKSLDDALFNQGHSGASNLCLAQIQ